MLRLDGVTKRFGGLTAVRAVDLRVEQGELVGIIGPNGAGKTTLFNLIAGFYRPDEGRVVFEGQDVTGESPHALCRRGLTRTFQVVQPFPEMTVLDNVAAGALFAGHAENRAEAEAAAREHLAFVGLVYEAHRPAASLPLPGRKRLELAKSLAMKPKVLLLDEVNAGLNTGEIEHALTLMRAIADRGITILIIEHLMKVVFSLSHRIFVLHQGALISQGKPSEVAEDERVIRAYLGTRFAERHKALMRHG